jgi:hypothetical protein
MAVSITNTYNGQAIPIFLQQLFAKMDVFTKNLVGLHMGITLKEMIPRTSISAATLRHYTLNPSASGTITLGERFLTPTDLIEVISDISPKNIENFWESLGQAKPSDPFVELQAPSMFRNEFVGLLIASVGDALATAIWTGVDSGTASFDGLITKLDAEGGYEDVSPGAPAVITGANVVGYLEDVRLQLLEMKALLEKENLKILVSKKTAGLLQTAANALAGKGPTFLTMPGLDSLEYYGIPIVSANGFPDNRIIATYVGNDIRNTNMHVGMRNFNDMANAKFYPQQEPSFGFGMKMAYSMGCQWAWTNQVVSLKAD